MICRNISLPDVPWKKRTVSVFTVTIRSYDPVAKEWSDYQTSLSIRWFVGNESRAAYCNS
ncbi:MAG: hypothetical protein Q4G68_06050 [Planctomycetia bacterium]|nr:hypothetical protein [Planctomycetia bacterium]